MNVKITEKDSKTGQIRDMGMSFHKVNDIAVENSSILRMEQRIKENLKPKEKNFNVPTAVEELRPDLRKFGGRIPVKLGMGIRSYIDIMNPSWFLTNKTKFKLMPHRWTASMKRAFAKGLLVPYTDEEIKVNPDAERIPMSPSTEIIPKETTETNELNVVPDETKHIKQKIKRIHQGEFERKIKIIEPQKKSEEKIEEKEEKIEEKEEKIEEKLSE